MYITSRFITTIILSLKTNPLSFARRSVDGVDEGVVSEEVEGVDILKEE